MMDVNERRIISSSKVGGEIISELEEEKIIRKGPWTMEEDLKLVDYITIHGEGHWNSLAQSAGLKRTGKSCRLRWLNYLRPDVRRGNITPQEQLLILQLHCHLGNRSTLEIRELMDYEKWISWNVKNNHRKKTTTTTTTTTTFSEEKSTSHDQVIGGGGEVLLDLPLRIAQTNKITISVSQDGSADFQTIKQALDTIPLHNTRRVILLIKPGVYREKIVIPRTMHFITFLGDSISDPPTITGNDTGSVIGSGGVPLRTFQSATVAVDSNYFMAINMKFENTAPHEVGSTRGQAVALRISGTKAAFYNCSFYGIQDTLYDHKGLHYFNNCFIQGSVDFIFGYGTSLYENCYLNSIAKKVAFLTAQKRTNSSLSSGFSFKNSKVTGSGLVYLGRAWGDYSRVVFSYTFMDNIVLPQGWSNWGHQQRNSRVYYGEYKCSGPGANMTGRVPWARILTDEEAQPFMGTHYINGDSWLITPIGN